MAINVSLVQFRDPQFLPRVRATLAETGISPDRIELEITESVAMMEADTVIAILDELKQMGIQIAIDDFGTGFSSLSYLHRLPIDRLKIDRTFVRDLNSQRGSGASIAQTVIRLGQSLGLSIIAEGIETEEQAQLLMDLGCPLAQGFLYSKPVDSKAFVAWCQSR
jgi:EAL domain-containing protein (putative c-di-GMP-specific phosphodiesterase class I)